MNILPNEQPICTLTQSRTFQNSPCFCHFHIYPHGKYMQVSILYVNINVVLCLYITVDMMIAKKKMLTIQKTKIICVHRWLDWVIHRARYLRDRDKIEIEIYRYMLYIKRIRIFLYKENRNTYGNTFGKRSLTIYTYIAIGFLFDLQKL